MILKTILCMMAPYVAKLPFKPDHEPLPDNFKVNETRLKSLKVRLKSKRILHAYDDIFKEYEKTELLNKSLLMSLWLR